MRRRSFPARPGLWRHRFVQIARELDAPPADAPNAAFGLRARPSAGALRGRVRGLGLHAG